MAKNLCAHHHFCGYTQFKIGLRFREEIYYFDFSAPYSTIEIFEYAGLRMVARTFEQLNSNCSSFSCICELKISFYARSLFEEKFFFSNLLQLANNFLFYASRTHGRVFQSWQRFPKGFERCRTFWWIEDYFDKIE